MRSIHHSNRKSWQIGDLVIHDRDAKEHRMLRVVVARLPGGEIRTVFAFRHELPESWRWRVFHDRPEHLHDPRRFHISTAKQRAA